MEGPSLYLAADQLRPFVGQEIHTVLGNTKIGKERLLKEKILSIFSYGKYLFFQFDTFALRIHFLLYGSFEAILLGEKITGDYPRKSRLSRLTLLVEVGEIIFYSCSLQFIEHPNAKELCDFSIDIMSKSWNKNLVFKLLKRQRDSEIADVLLDQIIFRGVGNIIKNEVLLMAKVSPTSKVKELSDFKLKKIVRLTREYVFQFYEWRKNFELKKHYQIYRQSFCKVCGTKVSRKKTGLRQRFSYICSHCQK